MKIIKLQDGDFLNTDHYMMHVVCKVFSETVKWFKRVNTVKYEVRVYVAGGKWYVLAEFDTEEKAKDCSKSFAARLRNILK